MRRWPSGSSARSKRRSDPAAVAVGLFERGPGRFEVFAHYDAPPQREALLALIAQAGGDGELGPLTHRGARRPPIG